MCCQLPRIQSIERRGAKTMRLILLLLAAPQREWICGEQSICVKALSGCVLVETEDVGESWMRVYCARREHSQIKSVRRSLALCVLCVFLLCGPKREWVYGEREERKEHVGRTRSRTHRVWPAADAASNEDEAASDAAASEPPPATRQRERHTQSYLRSPAGGVSRMTKIP